MKLYNGDWKNVAKKIDDESIDCIVTDPPFGCDYSNDIYNDSRKKIEKEMSE
jgi:predicted methyltransferase